MRAETKKSRASSRRTTPKGAKTELSRLKAAMNGARLPSYVAGYSYQFGIDPTSGEPEVQVWLLIWDDKFADQYQKPRALPDLCRRVTDSIHEALPHRWPYVWVRTVSEQERIDGRQLGLAHNYVTELPSAGRPER